MTAFVPLQRQDLGFTLDLTYSGLQPAQVADLAPACQRAHLAMQRIERGDVMNADEGRQVTHFSDRLAYPKSALCADVEAFFADIHAGRRTSPSGKPFTAAIINGIGGSALGPQLVQYALRGPYWNEQSAAARGPGLKLYFTDNTDSSGLTDALAVVDLATTLTIHISKSGGTQETRNNMVALEARYAAAGLDFSRHAAAITMAGSKLDQYAKSKQWLKVWPMADSIGGRTSVTAVVGHVPAAAAGLDFPALLAGACLMDEWTREADVMRNPAYLLATAWHVLGHGRGDRNMVIVPYADRLVLLSRYFQQLVMESLGKAEDRAGTLVQQGLSCFGNKGGTDAHAYIQQLNDGRDDFFVTFIEILQDQAEYPIESGFHMGDYLHNFMQGLVHALADKRRPVLTLTLETLNERSLGMIIALYERAVAFYAELVNINAFHQPGVEAYKKAAKATNELSQALMQHLASHPGLSGTAAAFAAAIGRADATADVAGILAKWAVNHRAFGGHAVSRTWDGQGWKYRMG